MLVSFLAILPGCQSQAPTPPEAQPVPVTVAKPLVTPIVEWDEYTGRMDAIDTVEIRARVSGYLESLHFREGDLVKAGQLLAIIDQRPFQAELDSAQAKKKKLRLV